ncbi:hypothetical protein BOTBODRAFT_147126 [Botryobasidium botryosum FD-172 SS1]|uniref:Uncharacterized protein n=1 Tax=Botryobasidium botryosum (strain FD-172 SS1) TaxID=930990 RepID=A0A067MA34_BOTB1|nr:hypothetical protein BOTBODRAFT_147126 [Botryobasidium botryosum FD-172 SS1]
MPPLLSLQRQMSPLRASLKKVTCLVSRPGLRISWVKVEAIIDDINAEVVKAEVDVNAVLALLVDLKAQVTVVLGAVSTIDVDVKASAVVTVLLKLFVTICTALKVVLDASVNIDTIVQAVADIVAVHVQILVAVSLKLTDFATLFLQASTQDIIALFLSVSLDVKATLKN